MFKRPISLVKETPRSTNRSRSFLHKHLQTQKKQICLFIKQVDGKTKVFYVNPNDKIQTLLSKLDSNSQYNFAGRLLTQKKDSTFWEVGLTGQQTIYQVTNLTGGMTADFIFNTLSQPVYRNFSQNAPQYRVMQTGINFQGICQNKNNCKAFNNKCWKGRGFGIFNVAKQTATMKCPLCDKKLKNVQNIGIYKCKIKIKGMLVNSDQEKCKQYENFNDNFLTFQDKDQSTTWSYMEIQVRKQNEDFST